MTTTTFAMHLKPGDHVPGKGDVTLVDPGYGYTRVVFHGAAGQSDQIVMDGTALPVSTDGSHR